MEIFISFFAGFFSGVLFWMSAVRVASPKSAKETTIVDKELESLGKKPILTQWDE